MLSAFASSAAPRCCSSRICTSTTPASCASASLNLRCSATSAASTLPAFSFSATPIAANSSSASASVAVGRSFGSLSSSFLTRLGTPSTHGAPSASHSSSPLRPCHACATSRCSASSASPPKLYMSDAVDGSPRSTSGASVRTPGVPRGPLGIMDMEKKSDICSFRCCWSRLRSKSASTARRSPLACTSVSSTLAALMSPCRMSW
mmetsp:Transcript_31013/g.47905  ORF Transcript_31013/g.47905 Transcript_31013/m.47905 type:complete len:205 (-) Transcript_31013:1769-2383(-)